MFPYETNATFVRGTCKRHSKYSFLPFGALGEKKTVLVVESKCLRVKGEGLFDGGGGVVFQQPANYAVPKQEDVGRVHSGSCFLAMLGTGDRSVSDVSFYSLSSFYAWWEAERFYADSFCELRCLICVAQLD